MFKKVVPVLLVFLLAVASLCTSAVAFERDNKVLRLSGGNLLLAGNVDCENIRAFDDASNNRVITYIQITRLSL